MSKNRCLRLRSIPSGKIAHTDLELCEEEMPVPADGEVLIKNLFASIDPTHRIWMSGKKAQYMDPVNVGEIMRAATVGVIVESKNGDWPVGKKV
jgi:NADPH-dependent curcumin reductase CurA